MSYLVLARKWRPQNFGDIVGQGHITRVLTNAILSNRIAHCYLLTGVRGVGKTTAARIIAKALNCEKGPTPEPCNQCSQCLEIVNGSSMDVFEIDGATNRGIDEVRQIIENVRYQPAKSRFKIYIIDEVHQVTKDAFNALLKTLEEPPSFVKFILATTEPHRLPETIRSRCQRFDFRRIPVHDIAGRLREIAVVESLRITEGALLLIAREAQGSMRDAQSLLEQVLSYAGPTEGTKGSTIEVDERLLQDILGIAERKTLHGLCAAVMDGKPGRCVELVAEVASNGLDLTRLSQELVEHFRNLLVARLALPTQSSMSGLLFDLHDQEIEELKRQVTGISVESLMDYFRVMSEGDEDVARSPYPRFALETTLVRLATLPKSMAITEALDRLENLERRISAGGEMEALPPNEEILQDPSATQVVSRTESPPSDDSAAQDKGEVWRQFVAFVMKEKRFLASHLEQVRPLEFPPGPLKIGVEDRHHLSYLQDRENLSMLKDFANRFFSSDVKVVISSSAIKSPDAVQASDLSKTVTGGGGDVVQEALRIFGGSIKEVKERS
ncbi:MAG: DNA polymerase III subunit gamma/tau [Candidatus Binatia bacterium]